MKSLAIAQTYGWSRYVAHQAFYSLVGREYEWELMPLAPDQKLPGIDYLEPLARGVVRKIRRNQTSNRRAVAVIAPPRRDYAFLTRRYGIVDAPGRHSRRRQASRSLRVFELAVAARRPTVASIIVGARVTREQLC